MRRREGAVTQRRQAVLRAAYALLGQAGTTELTVDAVARAAGVTRATVHNQFGSRRGLVEAVFADLAHRLAADEIHEALGLDDVGEALKAVCQVSARAWWEQRVVVRRVFALATLDDEVGSLVQAAEHARRRRVRPLVKRLVDGGVVEAGRVKEVAAALAAVTSFWGFEAVAFDAKSAREVAQRLWAQVSGVVHASSRRESL